MILLLIQVPVMLATRAGVSCVIRLQVYLFTVDTGQLLSALAGLSEATVSLDLSVQEKNEE